jgi:hypothetical protein
LQLEIDILTNQSSIYHLLFPVKMMNSEDMMQDQDIKKTVLGELASRISPFEHGAFKQRLGMLVASYIKCI